MFVGVYFVFLGLLVWGAVRFVLRVEYGVPVTEAPRPEHALKLNYRRLARSKVLETTVTPDDGYYDVLLLGGSVLEQVGRELEEPLRPLAAPQKVRIFNVAESAHTSRDSEIKYRYLADKPFDLIVIYHGINDARMNCVPPGKFRDDYTHCQWYRSLERRLRVEEINIPHALGDVTEGLIALGEPYDESLLDFGSDIRTPEPFRKNLESILQSAAKTPATVVLMTFGWCIPENYTKERFLAGEVGYADGDYKLAVEVWGQPENVRRTVSLHNKVIRDLADKYPDVVFVDQAQTLDAELAYFTDACHLSAAGTEVFVNHLTAALVEARR